MCCKYRITCVYDSFFTSLVFVDALKPIMTAAPCGPLVVPYSKHKDGHNIDSRTNDKVNIACDHGYVAGNSTAVCSPDGPGKSKWKGHSTCQR